MIKIHGIKPKIIGEIQLLNLLKNLDFDELIQNFCDYFMSNLI